MGPEPSASLDVERASARNRANSSEWCAGRYEAATRSVMVRVVVVVSPAAFLAPIATVIASRFVRASAARLTFRRIGVADPQSEPSWPPHPASQTLASPPSAAMPASSGLPVEGKIWGRVATVVPRCR